MCSISILPYKAKRSESFNGSLRVFVNKKVLQKGVKKVSTFNTQ